MVLFEGVVGLGIACLLAPAIAEYAKMRNKADKGFGWVAVAGVMFLFSGATSATTTLFDPTAGYLAGLPVAMLFEIVGWLFALIGTIFVGYEVLVEK
jgi:hypothetical protein